MAIRIKFDNNHIPLQPSFVLANRNGNKLGCIPAKNINFSDKFNGASEIQFKVHKEENGATCALWDEIVDFKLLWCPEWDCWFEIHVELTEADSVLKNISAVSVGEAELSQINLYNIEINTKNDIARDDYEVTVLYNETNPKASLLDRITDKAPHYQIGHVDDTIASIQRTFQFDDISLLDALYEIGEEIQCIFIIDSGTSPNGSIARTINAYDLQSNCNNCGHRDAFVGVCPNCGSSNIDTGYGQDTNIFISKENLTDEITYTSNTDSVKNCFRLVGGDDLMTATIANCNPNGGGYLWYFTDDMKEDMSDALRSKLNEYETVYNEYVDSHNFSLNSYAQVLSSYNLLAQKYSNLLPNTTINTIPNPIVGYSRLMQSYYDTIDFEMLLRYDLMPYVEIPGTTAAQEVAKLTSEALSPVAVTNLSSVSASTASSAALYVAKQIVRSDYQVKVDSGRLNDDVTWTGRFIVTNYSDEEDTATGNEITISLTDNKKIYIEQRINKILSGSRDDITDIISLFELDLASFTVQLKYYGLSSLNILHDACQSCIDIMITQLGITDSNPTGDGSSTIYNSLYLPYYNKLTKLSEEISLREQEIEIICGSLDEHGGVIKDGMQTVIQSINKSVQDYLDFEKYLGTNLVLELAAYRREDTYENDNFISDGFDNKQIFDKALEFIKLARVEIFKSATLQHSISSTLKNLLVMKEFSSITNLFEVGNWLCIRVADKTYRLRLSSYQIDFDSIENISVEFSDVVETMYGNSDAESILKSASSMSSAFGSVKRQASRGNQSHKQLTDYMENGLALTQMKIINDSENQNVTMDYHGLLCREKVPYNEEYDDKQLKIINKGLYLTDDAWRTSRAGIGEFIYYDPDDGNYKTKYGVVADMLIAPLILSEDVGIYNMNNTIRLNKNGLTIISSNDNTNPTVFQIQTRKTVLGEEVIENVIYFDAAGNAYFNGTLSVQSVIGNRTVSQLISNVDATITQVVVEYASNQSSTSAPQSGWSTTAPEWQQGYYIWQRTATTSANGTVYSNPTCISGRDGSPLTITTIQYAKGTSGTTAPTSGWQNSIPSVEQGKWLWVKTTYSDGSAATTCSYMGTDGEDGKSIAIQSVIKNNGVTTVKLTDSDGSTKTLTINDGEDGDNGVAGANGYVHVAWANSADGQTDFSTSVSANKRYMGVYTDNTQADSQSPSAYSWSLIKGADGTSVTITTIQYAKGTSGTTAPTSGWQNSIPSVEQGKWLWVKTTYSDGSAATTCSYMGTDADMSQQEIFNRLTNNGQSQGLFFRNGLLYVNADYIGSGHISADVIQGGTIDGTSVNAKLLNIVDNNNNVIASFDNKITLGNTNSTHTEIDSDTFTIIDDDGNTVLSLGDLRDDNGQYVFTESTLVAELEPFAGFPGSVYTPLSYTPYNGTSGIISVHQNGVLITGYQVIGNTIEFDSSTSVIVGGYVNVKYIITDPIFLYNLGKRSIRVGGRAGAFSTIEGINTYASGDLSHAEGNSSEANGYCSHAEGYYAIADGNFSHAEGDHTQAGSMYQHVFGSYNVVDSAGVYAEIVGGGYYNNRANIRTLRRNGNEWIAGTLTQSSDSRLKTEIGEIPDVSSIKARRFMWNEKKNNRDDKEHLGYFAQDIEKIAPYLVDEDDMGYKSLDYNGVFVAKIAILEQRIAELEKRLSNYESLDK